MLKLINIKTGSPRFFPGTKSTWKNLKDIKYPVKLDSQNGAWKDIFLSSDSKHYFENYFVRETNSLSNFFKGIEYPGKKVNSSPFKEMLKSDWSNDHEMIFFFKIFTLAYFFNSIIFHLNSSRKFYLNF